MKVFLVLPSDRYMALWAASPACIAEADSRAHDVKQVADKAGHETRLSINHASE